MNYVSVTLVYPNQDGNQKKRDLILPLDISQYVLVDNILEALEITVDSNLFRGMLLLQRNGSTKELPLDKTLRYCGIQFGDVLALRIQKILARASLICVDGPDFDLSDDDMIIGCHSDADIDLRSIPKQEFISERHAIIRYVQGNYYIEDLGSMNGTYVQKKKIASRENVVVTEDDILSFGGSGDEGIQMQLKIRD